MTVKRLGSLGTVFEPVEEILTSGTSWTPPAGVTLLDIVICIGGGQGGAGANAAGATNTQTQTGGNGGNGGNIATFFRYPVSGAVTYQIGAGSAGANGGAATTGTSVNGPSSSPAAGGNTWFGSSGFVAQGGSNTGSAENAVRTSGGVAIRFSGASANNIPLGTGGRGGEGSRTEAPADRFNGHLYFPTVDGNNIITSTNRAALSYIETGGGAGGSGTSATASTQYGRGGGGGSNTAGGTASAGGQATNANLNGGNGSGYGGAGGGGAAVKANSVAGGNGGTGANGAIILRYQRPVSARNRSVL